MADLKSIANMQIGGPKYPKKRRINLYQKQVKKGKIAAELGVFVVFMGLVYGFSQFGVVRLLRKADQAEAVYAATEQQLSALQKSNLGSLRFKRTSAERKDIVSVRIGKSVRFRIALRTAEYPGFCIGLAVDCHRLNR